MPTDSSIPIPAASVLIPTKNRKQMLTETVRSVLQQSISVEVIIVDDASIDGTFDFIQNEFATEPRVRIVRQEISRGPTAARNLANTLATSPYLFTIDDDCRVPSPLTFQQTIALFDHPRIAAVTIPFINVHQNQRVNFRAPEPTDHYVTVMFFGGMIAFRRTAYIAVGGYSEAMIMHVEEPELAARLMEAGYVIRLGTADPIEHLESPIRDRRKILVLSSRNHMLFHWFNTPWPDVIWRIPGAMFGTLIKASKVRRPDLALKGMGRGVAAMWTYRRSRKPVTPCIHRLIRRIRFSAPRMSEVEPFLGPVPG